ncbi:patatin-like phospholipase family protein [Persicobacter diffluens]|uniref:Patatin n=1 Tax=Persicobacter diffluens TaxID=981 RepID=A0AAN4W3I0_9BACT|nr:patatin [Persicobacter diffluens]
MITHNSLKYNAILLLCLVLPHISWAQTKERPKVGIVLSGGGAKGLAHIGALKVIEEIGVPIDYVAGNSMGSIVGALYAMGYSAEELDSIARHTPWETILIDQIDRASLNLEERDNYYKTFLRLDFDKKGIHLPGGVVEGHNVTNLLNELCAPAFNSPNWDDFPIPFRCVATDIVTGEEVIFDHGYLPDALRASMSIPSVFAPIEIEGRLLVDGMIINNYPVDVVRNMGADIIIGLDVHGELAQQKDLNSMFAVLNQTMSFYGEENYRRNKELVDLSIRPDLSGYSAGSFSEVDTLTKLGELAALEHREALQLLADSLNANHKASKKKRPFLKSNELRISKVDYVGSKNISKRRKKERSAVQEGDPLNFENLKETVDRMYASRFFKSVSYEILPSTDSSQVEIAFRAKDRTPGSLGIGLHYDPDFGPGILFQGSYNNLFTKDSRMNASLKISKNLRVNGDYWWYGKNRIDYSLGVDFDQMNFNQQFGFTGFKTELYLRTLTVDYMAHTNLGKSWLISTGIAMDYTFRDSDFEKELNLKDSTNGFYLGARVAILRDNLDKPYYPHKGGRFKVDSRLVKHFGEIPLNLLINIKGTRAFPLSPQFTLLTKGMLHINYADQLPGAYYAIMGGRGNNYKQPGVHSFHGFKIAEITGPNALLGSLAFQYEVLKDHYLQMHMDAGKVEDNRRNLFTFHNWEWGAALTYGYNSFIGPIELTTSFNSKDQFLLYLNIGFWI